MKHATIPLTAWLGIALLLAACASRHTPTLRVSDYRGPIRVACIGDSITYGAGVENREKNCYPAVLSQLLGEPFQVRNFGVSGATLLRKGDKPYWQEPEFAAVSEFQPHIIIIKLGTNDTKPQNARYDDEFAADLRALVAHYRVLATRPKVWLCLPVPVYGTRWGINEQALTETVIPAILQVADDLRLPVIDLHTALSHRPSLFPDMIHPNAAGATVIAQTVHDALIGTRK